MSGYETRSRIARVYLWLCVLTFIGLGLLFMCWPHILHNVDVVFETNTALADIRADYGGCIIGLGIFLAWCGLSDSRIRIGLLCSGLTLSGYALGRIYSLLVDGMPKRIIFILLAIEVTSALIAFVLMAMVGQSDDAVAG